MHNLCVFRYGIFKMEKKISERTPDFAKNLKKYLGQSGMTMEQLAEKADLSLHTIKGFLYRGEDDPRLSTLVRLAVALDCTINDLVGYRKSKRIEESEKVLKDIKALIDAHFD